MLSFIDSFNQELEIEAAQTRRMLKIIPEDKMDYKPHVKSMKIKSLANHIADMPLMIAIALDHPKWDFANSPYPSVKCNTVKEILDRFEYSISEAKKSLTNAKDDILEEPWSMGMGDITYFAMPRWQAIRHAFGQNAHHRAQLQVCLRLLDIPVPGPYGPSADEMGK